MALMVLSRRLILALLGFLVLSGCRAAPEAAAVADRNLAKDQVAASLRHVETTIAQENDIDQLVVVTGTLAADQEVALGFKVTGRLVEIPVDLGSEVQKGSPIAKLDTTDFELRVRQAEAALQQARVRLGLPFEASDQSVVIEQT